MVGRTQNLVAAAARYVKKLERAAEPNAAWQKIAWGYWDDTPEARFAATWIGNSMGRARLIAGKRQPDGSVAELPPEHRASQLVASVAGGPAGQAQMLTEFGPHLVMAGEAWTVIMPDTGAWHLLSVLEVKSGKDVLEMEVEGIIHRVTAPNSDDPPSLDEPLAIRVWQPDPRRHINADSPIRSAFALLDELRLLNAAVAAIAKSRLTGRGIVFVPQGTKFPAPATGSDGSEDDLIEMIMQVAETAYMNPDSAAAAVPIFLEVPAEFIGQAQKMTFESEFDTLAVELREETIRRFATGMDTPAEVLLGTSEINHWGQWAIDEAGIRLAVEPRLVLICDGYTTQWLQPALHSEDVADADECIVWYDASNIRVKANRGETAIQLYDRGEITGNALRRETNFDDADKPTAEQAEKALLERLVTAAPSLSPIILPALGIDLGVPPEALDVTDDDGDVNVEEVVDPDPTIPVGEDEAIPSEGLLAAADGLVCRALERSGQKIRSRTGRARRPELQEIEASAMHVTVPVGRLEIDTLGLLDGAWDRVPEIAARYGVDEDCLLAALDGYSRDLIAAGVEHCFEQVRAVLHSPCMANGVSHGMLEEAVG